MRSPDLEREVVGGGRSVGLAELSGERASRDGMAGRDFGRPSHDLTESNLSRLRDGSWR